MSELAHKIALDPTIEQARAFTSFGGCHRVVWNFALGCWWAWWCEYERSGRTIGKPNMPEMKRTFNDLRHELFPWMNDPLAAHRDCWSQPFADLERAFRNWLAGRADRPSFKSKHRSRLSFYVANDKLRFNGRRVHLPKIGWMRMRETLRFQGKMQGARVSQDATGSWSVAVQVEGDFARQRTGDGVVGLDFGILHAITDSDGQTFDTPKPLAKAQRRLARAQRVVARRVKGSNRRHRAVACVGRIHAHVKNIRNDFIHKTTTSILRENQAVGIEDLNVKGMLSNQHLARALSDVALGEMRRQIEYKAPLYETAVVIADRWFPSSKLCSNCGCKKDKLGLSQRAFVCEACGFVLDRDVNAALNLKSLVGRATAEPSLDNPATTRVESHPGSWKRELNKDRATSNGSFVQA